MPWHRDISGQGVHTPITFVFADEAARLQVNNPYTSAPYTPADIYKMAIQQDNETFWFLDSISPTWTQLGGLQSSGKIEIAVKGAFPGSMPAGTVVYFNDYDEINNLILVAPAKADSQNTMPAVGILKTATTDTVEGVAVVFGELKNQNTSAFSRGDSIYVSSITAGTITNARPTGSSLIQKMGEIIKDDPATGIIGVIVGLRVNSLPNLSDGNVWMGNSSSHPVETNLATVISANADVSANTAARHDAVTVSDTGDIDLTLAGQQISADLTTTGVTPGAYTQADVTVNDKGRITAIASGSGPQDPQTLLNEDWETNSFATNGWVTVNDTTNQWIIGSADAITGTYSAYISNNSTDAIYTVGTAQVSHLYVPITIPAGVTAMKIDFNYISEGEFGYPLDDFDYCRVFITDDTFTPTAGVQPTESASVIRIGDPKLLFQPTVAAATWIIEDIPGAAGTTRKLLFTWVNDSSGGTQPPVIIDDIVLRAYYAKTVESQVFEKVVAYSNIIGGYDQLSSGVTSFLSYVGIPRNDIYRPVEIIWTGYISPTTSSFNGFAFYAIDATTGTTYYLGDSDINNGTTSKTSPHNTVHHWRLDRWPPPSVKDVVLRVTGYNFGGVAFRYSSITVRYIKR